MSARRKGNRNRRACINLLEKEGWMVDVVEKTGRFTKIKDLYSLFDLIGVRSPGEVILVQVSTNVPHTHKHLKAFKSQYPLINTEQFVWVDRKGFKRFVYGGERGENLSSESPSCGNLSDSPPLAPETKIFDVKKIWSG